MKPVEKESWVCPLASYGQLFGVDNPFFSFMSNMPMLCLVPWMVQ